MEVLAGPEEEQAEDMPTDSRHLPIRRGSTRRDALPALSTMVEVLAGPEEEQAEEPDSARCICPCLPAAPRRTGTGLLPRCSRPVRASTRRHMSLGVSGGEGTLSHGQISLIGRGEYRGRGLIPVPLLATLVEER